MILILTDQKEPTTDLIIDWLIKLQKKFIRISAENIITIKNIYFENNKLEAVFSFDNSEVDTKDITSYWYRRSCLGWKIPNIDSSSDLMKALSDFRYVEEKQSILILNHILNSKAKLNKYEDNELIKIVNLELALSVGLNVPRTFISKNKNEVQTFQLKNKIDLITKTIGDPISFFHFGIHQFTSKVESIDLKNNFSLSLFQEKIKKKFELRIFYFDCKFFSSAIFSQESKETSVDLKNYSLENPNRVVPYKLPNKIELKLSKLMRELKLLSGSIDMVVDQNDNFIFIEVNPIGQFEQVSFPCNYNLPKKIAEFL